jgi:alkylation response protein AidB-like acyl-CoA dehydrogenase
MDFSLSEETTLLKNSAERFLQEKCPPSLVRELIKDDTGFSKEIWREMAELGWLGLIYDEKYGGSEGTFFDLLILFEEIGKVLLPSPFFCSAVLSGLAINEAGDAKLKDEYLPAIIHGEKILTLALLDEQGRYDGNDPKMEAKKAQGEAYLISGTRLLVPYAHIADGILLCANVKDSGSGGPTLFEVDKNCEGQQMTFLDTLTEEKTFAIKYDNVEVPSERVIGSMGEGNTYLSRILPKATLLKCGEMLGGMQRVVDMTIAHVKERHQFGRPLGSLQVVQHYCADMTTYLETSRLIVYQAASLISEGLPCDKEIAMAKAWLSDAYKKCTWIGHQIHGGIGFTEEYDLHLYYKHAKASELAFENSWFHRNKVAQEMGI